MVEKVSDYIPQMKGSAYNEVSTGETNLAGVLLWQATKKSLSTYLSEKIWAPVGMEQQATWIPSRTGTKSAVAYRVANEAREGFYRSVQKAIDDEGN